ncbi:hypothetical protein NDU88_000998 [Pleurodeles waltl]|uniref:Uncharacterized protein n=1 Tax=Pleurodeles waltl TaxID=8319 RepID=A0AAV7TH37_PLEWA|nr:hypothetical protein NDU88_000998 [Pleurodeles waltl]
MVPLATGPAGASAVPRSTACLTAAAGILQSPPTRMYRMTERLDKHAKRLDATERIISDIEDDQATIYATQSKMDKTLTALQARVEDLKASCHRNNLRVVSIAEPTFIDNMEKYIEQLFATMLGCETFSNMLLLNECTDR